MRGFGRMLGAIGSSVLLVNLSALWLPHNVDWQTVWIGVGLIVIFAVIESRAQ